MAESLTSAHRTRESTPTFAVDTHLFTELGELLVGRDSTALAELVKNAYDADARHVTIFGERLSDPTRGLIRVVDDGTGMTEAEFTAGFLRIAGQGKQAGTRRSAKLQRRFTGAKGIGRLAAHKLARCIEVDSVAARNGSSDRGSRQQLHATINWDQIEEHSTLEEVRGTGAIQVESSAAPDGSPTGTAITLRPLRGPWSSAEKSRFLAEMQTFEAPRVLWERLPTAVVSKPLLFENARIRDSSAEDKGMLVALEGEFAFAEDYWQVLAEQSTWVLEIEAAPGSNVVRYAFAPTQAKRDAMPRLTRQAVSIAHPDATGGPFFHCRILCREGQWPRTLRQADVVRRSYGVRVFMEGFRVLPYGEPGNDWLELDQQYTSRGRSLPNLSIFGDTQPVKQEGLTSLPNNNYFGAVFMTVQGAPTLRTLVNREGFVPDRAFEELTHLVRLGIDLLTRARARSSLAAREERRRERLGAGATGVGSAISEALTRATKATQEARSLLAAGDSDAASVRITAATNEIGDLGKLSKELISQADLVRVLASVGTQLAAFTHEVNGLLGIAVAVEAALQTLRDDQSSNLRSRSKLTSALASVTELRSRLERQSAYLLDVVSADARRRRIRMSFAIRFDTAVQFLGMEASRKQVTIENKIPTDLATPLMFPAETTAVFSNLLSNAIKAAEPGGRIVAAGFKGQGESVQITLENTGVSVDLNQAEEWFLPFTSTTHAVEPALGQGMGLGLPITRALLAEYGASISFVTPSPGFSTAVQILWPQDR